MTYVILCFALSYYTMIKLSPRYIMLCGCYVVLWNEWMNVMLSYVMLWYAMLRYVMLWNAVICDETLFHVVLCHLLFCYVFGICRMFKIHFEKSYFLFMTMGFWVKLNMGIHISFFIRSVASLSLKLTTNSFSSF